jgi:hypothetical protein
MEREGRDDKVGGTFRNLPYLYGISLINIRVSLFGAANIGG